MNLNQFIEISNAGPIIKSTNYWQMEHTRQGYLYLSPNAGCVRLLIPKVMESEISEMQTGKVVIISKGFWEDQGRDAVEVMFDDYSDNPYTVHLVTEQCQMVPKDSRKWKFSAWTESGLAFEKKKCKVRTVGRLPYMMPWGK